MKKLVTAGIVASALLLTNASADTKWYAGVEVGSASNTTEYESEIYGSVDGDNNYKDIKFVVGKGTGDNWYTQLYLSKITYDEGQWFSDDDEALEIGVEVMKQFKAHEKVYPFLKFGLGVASMDTTSNFVDSSISAVSLTLGAGVDFKVTENISILGGLDYNYKKWQDAESLHDTVSTSDSGTRFYVGANYRF